MHSIFRPSLAAWKKRAFASGSYPWDTGTSWGPFSTGDATWQTFIPDQEMPQPKHEVPAWEIPKQQIVTRGAQLSSYSASNQEKHFEPRDAACRCISQATRQGRVATRLRESTPDLRLRIQPESRVSSSSETRSIKAQLGHSTSRTLVGSVTAGRNGQGVAQQLLSYCAPGAVAKTPRMKT